jgi:hypothetical protein
MGGAYSLLDCSRPRSCDGEVNFQEVNIGLSFGGSVTSRLRRLDQNAQDGIRAKLDRANEHLETLKGEIGAFLGGEPHTYWTKADIHNGRYSVHVTINAEPPLRLSVICGDYIQCLRSALDYLVCAVVPKVTKRTAFPIYENPDDYFCSVVVPARRKRQGPLTGLDVEGDLFTAIQQLQPHEGPHGHEAHFLFLLRELSNMDKHRAILARAAAHSAVTEPIGMVVHDVRLGHAQYELGQPLKNGAKVAWGTFVVTGPEPHVEMEGDFPVEVAFGDPLVRLDGLEQLRDGVREVIALAFKMLDAAAL